MQFRKEVARLTDDELDNERYTLQFERQWLDMSDDEVADRLNICDVEQHRRATEGS